MTHQIARPITRNSGIPSVSRVRVLTRATWELNSPVPKGGGHYPKVKHEIDRGGGGVQQREPRGADEEGTGYRAFGEEALQRSLLLGGAGIEGLGYEGSQQGVAQQ